MMKIRLGRPSSRTLLGGLAVVMVTGGVAVASGTIPGSDGEIDACYGQNGSLRVVADGESCRSAETALAWNQKGVQGDQGPKGDTGAAGAAATKLWAIVADDGALADGSGATAAVRNGAGSYTVTFNQDVTACVSQATATDVFGGVVPAGSDARVFGTDNRKPDFGEVTKINVSSTNLAGEVADPRVYDGFVLTVFC